MISVGNILGWGCASAGARLGVCDGEAVGDASVGDVVGTDVEVGLDVAASVGVGVWVGVGVLVGSGST